MLTLAVSPETLAMIAHDAEDGPPAVRTTRSGPVRCRARRQALQETPHLRVDEGQLAVVGLPPEEAAVWLGRAVRCVRVVQVHPDEEGLFLDCSQPGQGALHRHRRCSLAGSGHLRVVDLEAAVQPVRRRQDRAAPEGAGAVHRSKAGLMAFRPPYAPR